MDGRSSTDRWLWRRISNGATTQIGYRSQRYITVSCRLADDASLLIFQSDRFRCRTAEIQQQSFDFLFFSKKISRQEKKPHEKLSVTYEIPLLVATASPHVGHLLSTSLLMSYFFFFILIYSQQTASRWMQLTWMRQASKTIPRLFIVSSIDTCNTQKKINYFLFVLLLFYFFLILILILIFFLIFLFFKNFFIFFIFFLFLF